VSWSRVRGALYLGGLAGTATAVLLGHLGVVCGRLIPLAAAVSWLPFFGWLTFSRGRPVQETRATSAGEMILQAVGVASWVVAGFLAVWGVIEWSVASFVAVTGMLPWSIVALRAGRDRSR
jgi:hypothetical protein